LAREVGQGLDGRPRPLDELGARFRGELSALLDQRQHRVGLELTGTQSVNRSVQALGQLAESVDHDREG
jgi:hypothetical protein